MIKRMVEISRKAAYLSVKDEQLRIGRRGEDTEEKRIPCEDIGVLVVDQGEVTYSHHALATLLDSGTVVVLCGRNHLPAGYLLPYPSHTEVVVRAHNQINAGKVLKKQLWQQLVVAKIRTQMANLQKDQPQHTLLRNLASKVRSGDPANVEAQAAKAYWKAWLGPGHPFRRDPDGDGLNAVLNYGYAIIRAAIARTLTGSGLLPLFGIHHCNRSNAFCLADDLLEPLRPLVDHTVRELHRNGEDDLSPTVKGVLLGQLQTTAAVEEEIMPLQIAIKRMVDSLVRCYAGEAQALKIPTAPPQGATHATE